MKKIISILIISLLIMACAKNDVEDDPVVLVSGDSSDYKYVIPFDSNYVRFAHIASEYMEIGKGLVELSKEYYDTSKYYLKEGSVLGDYRNDYQPLVKLRESTDNPSGLNPHRDTKLKVNENSEVTGPLLVSDIFEIDFMSTKNTDEIAGVSLALVLNKSIYDDNGNLVVVDDNILYEFGTEIAGPKLESYLRKKPELNNTPIMIAIYVVDNNNLSVPGNYIAKAQYINRQGKFEKINHRWLLFPTNTSASRDPMLNEQIISLKRSVLGFIPEDIGIVAYGEYKDDSLEYLKIDVNVQTKTYTEILALSNYIGEIIMSFDFNVKIIVEIQSLNDTLSIIKKAINASKAEVIVL